MTYKVRGSRGGFAIGLGGRASIVAPTETPTMAARSIDLGSGVTRPVYSVQVEISTVPSGATHLIAQVGSNVTRPTLLDSGMASAVVGSISITLPIIAHVTEPTPRMARLAWANTASEIGTFSEWVEVSQVPPVPGEVGFRAVTSPALILNTTTPLAVGTVLDATDATFEDGVEPYTITTTIQTASDASGTGVADDGHVLGANIAIGMVGKHVRAKTVGEDDDATEVIAYSPWSEVAVFNPAPTTALVVTGHRWVTTATNEYQIVLTIAGINPATYAGHAGDLKPEWARKPANPDSAPAWEILSPYNYAEGEGATVSGTSGEWRTNTLSTATTGNWIRPHLRMPVHRPPDQHNLLLRYSLDDGVNYSPTTEIDLTVTAPVFPWLTAPPAATGTWRPLDASPAQRATAGLYGLGKEYARDLAGNGNRYYMAGDMAGLRRSDDAGSSWYHPRCLGLPAFGFNGVAVDPVNADRVIVWAHAAWMSGWNIPPYSDHCTGIYYSTDGGDTFTRGASATLVPSSHQNSFAMSNFCYDPATIGSAHGSRRWYLMYYRNGLGGQLLTSANGGASWAAQGTAIAGSKWTNVRMLRMHPTIANRFYVCANNGLWRSTVVPTGSGSFALVGGTLPATMCRSMSISPDGETAYASIQSTNTSQRGVWKSTNFDEASPTWTRVDSTNSKDLAVDWVSSPHVVYSRNPDGQNIRYSVNGGSSFATSTAAETLPGDNSHPLEKSEFEAFMVPHTSIAGICVNHAADQVAKTVNKGVSWTFRATQGFTGINTALQNIMIAKHPTIAGRFDMAAEDQGRLTVTANGAGGLVTNNVVNTIPRPGNPSGQNYWKSGRTSSSAIGILRSGRVILAAGALNQLLFRQQPGASTWTPGIFTGSGVTSPQPGPPTADWTQAQYDAMTAAYISAMATIGCIKEHPTEDDVVWAGPYKSTNGGANWAKQTYSMVDMWPDGTGLFSSGNTLLYRSTNWETGSPTFTPFYQAPAGINLAAINQYWLIARCDPFDNQAVYTLGAGRDLVRARNTGSTFGAAVSTSLALQATSGLAASLFRIGSIAPDPVSNGTVYATIAWGGVSNIWRRHSGAWADITSNGPRWPFLSIDVHPDTGEPVVGGAIGIWMHARPSTYGSTPPTVWGNLTNPIPALLALST
jgi:hypothetical protein